MANWQPDDDDLAVAGRMAIGLLVRAARLDAGASQRQFAWRVNVAQSTISRLENGRLRGIRWPTLARIVGALYLKRPLVLPDGPPPPTRRLPGQGTAEIA